MHIECEGVIAVNLRCLRKAGLSMRRTIAILISLFLAGAAAAQDVHFSSEPQAKAEKEGVRIEFALSAPTDVEVAILDAQGKAVRHLASGMLGANAPTPLISDSLRPSLFWNRQDDEGKPVTDAVKVRVRAGMTAALDRFISQPGSRFGPVTALGVGKNGEVYVLSNGGHKGEYLYVLDREGKYLRTILPSPANLAPDELKGIERIKLPDGRHIPIVYQANAMHLAPFLSGMRHQQLVVTPQGWLIFASGGNDYSDQAVPRHVLVLKPDGSTPAEVGFVGPSLGPHWRYSIGLRPQQLAVSPDGKTIYMVGLGKTWKEKTEGAHAVGRLTWSSSGPPQAFIGDPDVPGDDASHLNDPVSLATDPRGNIYVVDAGNKRIVVFDAEGKPLGQTKVPQRPRQLCIHPRTGALYVLTQPAGTRWGPFAVIKYDRAIDGREVTSLTMSGRNPVLALDADAMPPKLWLGNDPGWAKEKELLPIIDRGDKLEVGANVQTHEPLELRSPLFLTVDAQREQLYVSDLSRLIRLIDLKTDHLRAFLNASELTLDREGNLYVLSGYGTNALLRYTPEGKPLPFSATGTNRIEVPYRAGLPHVGVRGLCVAPDGDIYVISDHNVEPTQVCVFGPDGSLKNEHIIQDIPGDAACSVALDHKKNIYIGINVKDLKQLYPDELAGRIPELAWFTVYSPKSTWYLRSRMHGSLQGPPWNRPYINFYLYHLGSVFKFSPGGGRFWLGPKGEPEDQVRPEGTSESAVAYRSGYLGRAVWLDGALWKYVGFSLAPNRSENWGDPACSCWTGRFAMDEHERLFVPDVFRFSIGVLDTNGNEILRFGEYGNVDSAGLGSALPEPAIPLGWPCYVSVGGDRVYISDRLNRRIAIVKLTYALEATCLVE